MSAFAACFFVGQPAGMPLGGVVVGELGILPLLAAAALGLMIVARTFALAFLRRASARKTG